MYTVIINKKAVKELEKIPKLRYKSIRDAIDGLESNPRPNGNTKIRGRNDTYRIRIVDYRIV